MSWFWTVDPSGKHRLTERKAWFGSGSAHTTLLLCYTWRGAALGEEAPGLPNDVNYFYVQVIPYGEQPPSLNFSDVRAEVVESVNVVQGEFFPGRLVPGTHFPAEKSQHPRWARYLTLVLWRLDGETYRSLLVTDYDGEKITGVHSCGPVKKLPLWARKMEYVGPDSNFVTIDPFTSEQRICARPRSG